MQYFLVFAANAFLGGLAGLAMADAAAVFDFSPLLFECTGLIGGCLAGAAAFV